MEGFPGFPDGKMTLTPVPDVFFNELLPHINHIGELKITLYFFWRLSRMEGSFRYLRLSDILGDHLLLTSFENVDIDPLDAIELASLRGTLLKAELASEQIPNKDICTFYFLNTPKGRAAIKAIKDGLWNPTKDPTPSDKILEPAPSIYRLYEENIGPLTPMIADAIKDAETTFPLPWIIDAMMIAVERNKRNWSYITAILDKWQREGRDVRKEKLEARGDSEESRRRYIKGKYSDFVEH